MKPRLLSREEEAELARSNKKVKDFHHAEFNNGSREGSPSFDFHNNETSSGASFKDKLVGDIPGAFMKAFDFESLMDEDLESDGENEEDVNRNRAGWVNVRLSKETKRRIRGPWSRAIIVKLVGRSVGFDYLKSKLSQLWKPSARMDCVDLGFGFFLVRFYSKEDLDSVLMKGPWFIGDHFLSIRPWEPFFKPSTANVSLIAVWIRLCELPIELYDAEVLKQIGESIGKVLRIDSHTTMEARGKYARLCIQVDVNKPLVNTICIGHFEQAVTYEGIHSLCFSCGRLGHKVEGCPYTVRKEREPLIPTEKAQTSCSDIPRDTHNAQPSSSAHASVDMGDSSQEDGHYGPWMVVERRMYGRKGTKPGVSTNSTRSATWQSSFQQPPSFSDGVNTSSCGPSGVPSKDVSIGGAYPRRGTATWAVKLNGHEGGSKSGPSSIKKRNDKVGDTSVAHFSGSSPSPPNQDLKKLPSSVKGKKALARKSSSKVKVSPADNSLSDLLAANITSLSSDRAFPSNREISGPSNSFFEFTAPPLAEPEPHGDRGSTHTDNNIEETLGKPVFITVKPVALTLPESGDDSVRIHSNPCASEGSGRGEEDVARMDLEDGSDIPSSD